jgi:hypothetical protein
MHLHLTLSPAAAPQLRHGGATAPAPALGEYAHGADLGHLDGAAEVLIALNPHPDRAIATERTQQRTHGLDRDAR